MGRGTLPTYPFDTPAGLEYDPEGLRLLVRAPVVRAVTPDGRELWLALGYHEVRQALSDPRLSREAATKPGTPTVTQSSIDPLLMVGMDQPRHTRIRRLVAAAFGPRRVERLEPRVQEMVDGLLGELAAQPRPADLVRLLAAPLPIMVICELLGVPLADRDLIREWAGKLMATTAYSPAEIHQAIGEVNAYLAELIERRRAEPDGALISALIDVNDQGDHLSPAELTSNVQLLLIAGHETTVNQLGNSVVTLFEHPEQADVLREKPELWPQAVDELLRHSMLVSSTLPRVAVADVELGGTLIRAGECVLPVVGVANRDPRAFPDPLRFDVLRGGPAPHLGLGHGAHYCLGANLAKLEMRLALCSLVSRFPTLEPAVDLADLRWKTGLAVRALVELPVTW
jgi:cytochrome P450